MRRSEPHLRKARCKAMIVNAKATEVFNMFYVAAL